jgi:Rrf2 family protein
MISKKCMYALKAVLALSRDRVGRPMTIQQIAEVENIPARFLEAILRDLKQNGLTESVRGKDGGYRLSRPPRELTVGDVIRAVESSWMAPPADTDVDIFSTVWSEATDALTAVVNGSDFQTLADRDALSRQSQVPDYSI